MFRSHGSEPVLSIRADCRPSVGESHDLSPALRHDKAARAQRRRQIAAPHALATVERILGEKAFVDDPGIRLPPRIDMHPSDSFRIGGLGITNKRFPVVWHRQRLSPRRPVHANSWPDRWIWPLRAVGRWAVLEALALPTELTVRDDQITIRRADMDDLGALMRLMADDPISAGRGDVNDKADAPAYGRALARIIDDPSNEAVVAIDRDGIVIGTLQLTSIPGMARLGSTRLLLEGVRVASDRRSSGVGSAMIRWVTDVAAPAVGASLVELSSSVERTDARRFYLRLGFADSHIGFKFPVAAPSPAAR